MFTASDLDQLQARGIDQDQALLQMSRFQTGFPYLTLRGCATTPQSVMTLEQSRLEHYAHEWQNYLKGENRIAKFVPASGAASRMFKALFEYMDAPSELPSKEVETFFENIHQFAFFDQLNTTCQTAYDKDVDYLIKHHRGADVMAALLKPEFMNYGKLPKALLAFHAYQEGARTPLEEHMVEAALYAKNQQGTAHLHFTVSQEHLSLVQGLVEQKAAYYEEKFAVKYDISYSVQKPQTDTLAADEENNPFRVDGKLLFRPGGHGALIENLNDIDADIVFIKNIDNVVPDLLKSPTILYKEALAGILVAAQKQIFDYIKLLQSTTLERHQLEQIATFMQTDLAITSPDFKGWDDEQLKSYLLSKLDRPTRVCGVVKNTGEPGGGPFLVENADGSVSGQILESSQIDFNNSVAKNYFENSTHFNPVDLVCAIKNHEGKAYNLTQYVDPQTGFIASKSFSGRTLKALELPGLWNGAMANWNTIFVEVPIETFNPVKIVNDLLREQHQ